MSVNLRRFVDIDIKRAKRNPVNPVRDTVALFNVSELSVSDVIFVSGSIAQDTSGSDIYRLVKEDGNTLDIAQAAFATSNLYKYAHYFFDNGGMKLHAYKADLTAETLNALPRNEIAVARVSGIDATINGVITTYNETLNVGTPNSRTSAAKYFFTNLTKPGGTFDRPSFADNVCVKLGDPGIEMLPMAYLSKINAYGVNTMHDYSFTIEVVDDVNAATFKENDSDNVTADDGIVAKCMEYNINVDSVLANQIRNIGGDLFNGDDLVNAYFTTVLAQTLEDAVVNALSEKLSGADGTAKIYNIVISELNKYVHSGLLSAGNWQDEDWIENYAGENFLIVSARERLVTGYKVYVVPFAALTSSDVAAHKCPPIYIAMTNAYGIRKINIFGEVM